MRHHQRKACGRHRNQRRRVIDHRAHRSVSRANHFIVGDHRAQPMREVNDLRTANAGEKVLVASGKPDNLVRKNRAANDDVIVVEDQLV